MTCPRVVTVTIGEFGNNVFMEWSGSLAAFPSTDPITRPTTQGFFTMGYSTRVATVENLDCKYCLFARALASHVQCEFLCGDSHNSLFTMHFLTGYSGGINFQNTKDLSTSPTTVFTATSTIGTYVNLATLQNQPNPWHCPLSFGLLQIIQLLPCIQTVQLALKFASRTATR